MPTPPGCKHKNDIIKLMPSRLTPLASGYYYHVFNRGVAKSPIFFDARSYKRFIDCMVYYQIENPKPRFSLFKPKVHILDENNKMVEIISYCLMPNHFHLLLYQQRDGGITEFLSKLENSYTKYFNTRFKRVGHLFQGEFKAVLIESNEQLIHVSRYIHLNPLVSGLVSNLNDFVWSSYLEYVNNPSNYISASEIILNQFSSENTYQRFVQDQIDYGLSLEVIKHQLLDHS